MKTHYYTYDGNLSPKVKHMTLESAQKEAERLTLQHGKLFEILKVIGVTKMIHAETEWLNEEETQG